MRKNKIRISIIFLLLALMTFPVIMDGSLSSAGSNESLTVQFTGTRPEAPVHELAQAGGWDPCGPYVDKMVVHEISGWDSMVLALLSGEIDHIADHVPEEYVALLDDDPNIRVTQTTAFHFAHLTINCERYPYSIPGFRRALAYAADKYELVDLMFGDLVTVQDSVVPSSFGVWHNDEITPDFRVSNIEMAKWELQEAGFVDTTGDRYVETPMGTQFTFQVMYPASACGWRPALEAQAQHWDLAGIHVELKEVNFGDMLVLIWNDDFDSAVWAYGLGTWGPPHVLEQYTSDSPHNHPNWENAAYDAYVETMMTSSDYDTVLQAAHNAQEVFVDEVPQLVWYSRSINHAHRTDPFNGWIVSPGYGTGFDNHWTPRKVRLQIGQPGRNPITGTGGTFNTASQMSIDTLNPLERTSSGRACDFVTSQIYDSLTGETDPRTHEVLKRSGLAYDWDTVELADGLRITFHLVQNAYWHDIGGTSDGRVTAHDVAFSYNYIHHHDIPRFSEGIAYFASCTAPDDYTVVINTNDKSYWAFEHLRNWPILPQHIWQGIDDPLSILNVEPIGSGPFKFSAWVREDFVALERWERYHYSVSASSHPIGANGMNARMLHFDRKDEVIHITSLPTYVDNGLPGAPPAQVAVGDPILFGFEWTSPGGTVDWLRYAIIENPQHDITVSVNGGEEYSVKSWYQEPFLAVPGSGPRWTWDHDGDRLGDGDGDGIDDWDAPVLFFRYQIPGLAAGTYVFTFRVYFEYGMPYEWVITVIVS